MALIVKAHLHINWVLKIVAAIEKKKLISVAKEIFLAIQELSYCQNSKYHMVVTAMIMQFTWLIPELHEPYF